MSFIAFSCADNRTRKNGTGIPIADASKNRKINSLLDTLVICLRCFRYWRFERTYYSQIASNFPRNWVCKDVILHIDGVANRQLIICLIKKKSVVNMLSFSNVREH